MLLFNMQGPPDFFEQLSVGHNFACVTDERGEEFVLYRREMDLVVGHEDLSSTQFDADVAKFKAGVGFWPVRSGRMTERSAHSGKELIDSKRFGHIIVGTEVECSNLLLFLFTR